MLHIVAKARAAVILISISENGGVSIHRPVALITGLNLMPILSSCSLVLLSCRLSLPVLPVIWGDSSNQRKSVIP